MWAKAKFKDGNGMVKPPSNLLHVLKTITDSVLGEWEGELRNRLGWDMWNHQLALSRAGAVAITRIKLPAFSETFLPKPQSWDLALPTALLAPALIHLKSFIIDDSLLSWSSAARPSEPGRIATKRQAPFVTTGRAGTGQVQGRKSWWSHWP